jgi:hypothetical protein
MGISGHDLDAFGSNDSFHQRVDPLIEGGNETQLKFWHFVSFLSESVIPACF